MHAVCAGEMDQNREQEVETPPRKQSELKSSGSYANGTTNHKMEYILSISYSTCTIHSHTSNQHDMPCRSPMAPSPRLRLVATRQARQGRTEAQRNTSSLIGKSRIAALPNVRLRRPDNSKAPSATLASIAFFCLGFQRAVQLFLAVGRS